MGSDGLITVKEAAALLGIRKQSVYDRVHRGYLHPRYRKGGGLNGIMLFNREEVAAAAEAWGKAANFSGLMSRCVQAYALARSLERRVAQLEELLGAHYLPPPTDEDSVRTIYLEAKDDLESPPADQERIGYWSNFFMSVGEEFFDTLEAYTSNEHAWEAFHDLSRAIAEEAPIQFAQDPELQETYRMFERARRNLRQVLFFHLRNRYGTKRAVKMFETDVSSHEKLVRFLMANPDRLGRSTSPPACRRSQARER